MSGTTEAPSPLADATRFIEPTLMSPTAKTPGTEVARSPGGSPSTQCSRPHIAPGADVALLIAELLVAYAARHQQVGVELALAQPLAQPFAERLGVLAKRLPVGCDQPPGGRHDRTPAVEGGEHVGVGQS
jgi:hypothetical protein